MCGVQSSIKEGFGFRVYRVCGFSRLAFRGVGWVLPPLSNSWIINIIWLYIALNRTPNIDCYWVGAVPEV